MIDGFDTPSLVYSVLLLVLVASSLLAMRIPMRKALKMALAWVAIFGAAFVAFAFRGELSGLGSRLRAEATGAALEQGGELRIPIAADGHFYVEALVNDHPVRFMVDSGATVTTMGLSDARAAGVAVGSLRSVVSTANGTTEVSQGTADEFAVGPIRRTGFPVNVSAQAGLNLIGMNFLSTLRGWRVEGTYLVLAP